jgi:rod shape-determining protein MreC
MRKLFAFFRRFQIFLFFVALQFLALSTYFTYLTIPRSQYLSTANNVNGALWGVQNFFIKYIRLDETNSKLLSANKRLREKLPENYIRLENGLIKIEDTLYHQQYAYTPATVINSTYDKRNNFMTLNIGSLQKVKRGMGVISDEGLVGVVFSVSEHFSLVKSVLSKNINIPVMLEKSGAFGFLKWETQHERYANISGISNDIPVKKWEKVVTRGGEGMFPSGIIVGRISSVKPIEGKPLWEVTLKLGVNFKAAQKVYVVKNILKEEQDKLETKTPKEKEDE